MMAFDVPHFMSDDKSQFRRICVAPQQAGVYHNDGILEICGKRIETRTTCDEDSWALDMQNAGAVIDDGGQFR